MASLLRFTWLGLVLILVGCRQDMHDQPRMKTYAMSDFYADLRSERPPVEGTVARGQLHEDTYFYTGKIGANPGDYMPSQVPGQAVPSNSPEFEEPGSGATPPIPVPQSSQTGEEPK